MRANNNNIRSTEEIIEALKVIKDVCDRFRDSCNSCPLRDKYDECGLCEMPADWEIHSPSDWRAF